MKKEELILKYKLSYSKLGGVNHWGGKRYHYNIRVNRTSFKYYGSIADFNNKKYVLSDLDLLLAFRAVINDALSYEEHKEDKAGFFIEFGYLENNYIFLLQNSSHAEEYLTKEEYINFKSGLAAYEGCKDTYNRLKITNNELYNILQELSDNDIE